MTSDVRDGDRDTATIRRLSRTADPDRRPAPHRRMVAYDPIVRLTVRHEYEGLDSPASGIGLTPSPRTRQDLDDRGWLFRTEPEGGVVLGEQFRDRVRPAADDDAWLTFRIDGSAEYFALVSDVDLDAGTGCLYLSPAPVPADAEAIPASAAVRCPQRVPLLPAVFDASIERGQTLDIRHQTQRVMSVEWPATSPAPMASDASIEIDTRSGRARFDLSALPDGRYRIERDGRPLREGLRLTGPRLPAALAEVPMPDARATAAAPSTAAGACAHYDLTFAARRTIWKYSIVPRSGSGPLENLSIELATNGATGPGASALRFIGPFEDALPNGVRAYQFLSAGPIALRRRSPVRLRLTGRRKERMTRDAVLVEYLPVPAGHQLALLTDRDVERLGVDAPFCSEMFVYV